jgi:hypothetical protein
MFPNHKRYFSMKIDVFCCLRSVSDSQGRTQFLRAKITVDPSQKEMVGLYIFPGSEHTSCIHEPSVEQCDCDHDLSAFADLYASLSHSKN